MCGYENCAKFHSKDSTEAKILLKVLGRGLLYFDSPCRVSDTLILYIPSNSSYATCDIILKFSLVRLQDGL